MKSRKKIMAAVLAISLTTGIFTPAGRVAQQGRGQSCVQAASRSTTSTQDSGTKNKDNSSKSGKAAAKKIKKAKKYIGKKYTSLVKAIGKPKKFTKARSCLNRNEYDGIAKYNGFRVYCHTENKVWIIDDVR